MNDFSYGVEGKPLVEQPPSRLWKSVSYRFSC